MDGTHPETTEESGRRGGGPVDGAFIAVLSCVLLFLCMGVAVRPTQASRPPPLVPVPLISQGRPWSCGAASLMSVLVYYGVFDDAESQLDAELRPDPERGTAVTSIVAAARRFGLDAEARTGLNIDDLAHELTSGAVVIAAIQAWPAAPVRDWRTAWEDGHYVVVVGVSRERVYVMDPSVRTGYGYLPRDEFVARWHDYDVEGQRQVVWERMGIVIRGGHPLERYPAEPVPVE